MNEKHFGKTVFTRVNSVDRKRAKQSLGHGCMQNLGTRHETASVGLQNTSHDYFYFFARIDEDGISVGIKSEGVLHHGEIRSSVPAD